MDAEERARFEAAHFTVTDAQGFLGLTDQEMALIDTRIALARALAVRRRDAGISQRKLATMMNTSQARVARIETGQEDVSLDQMFKTLFALGATPADIGQIIASCSVGVAVLK